MQQFLHISGALYDESRVKILAFLARYGELCVCDLQASLGMIQSRLSRHLKILKEAGFLSVRREGVWAHYGICEELPCFCKDALRAIESLELELPPLQRVRGCE